MEAHKKRHTLTRRALNWLGRVAASGGAQAVSRARADKISGDWSDGAEVASLPMWHRKVTVVLEPRADESTHGPSCDVEAIYLSRLKHSERTSDRDRRGTARRCTHAEVCARVSRDAP